MSTDRFKSSRFDYQDLIAFTSQLLTVAGLPGSRALVTAQTLVEGDLLGHTTHGVALMDPYLSNIERGEMMSDGEPEVVRDLGSAITWDGRYLPGCWLTHRAIDVALERIKEYPSVTVVISKSHHIGCLAAYPERATSKDLMMILSCSDPINETVAPYGGLTGKYSPNPIAYGVPTEDRPIIVDISTSTTSNGMVNQLYKRGEKLPHPWLLDHHGKVTDDPNAFFADPAATILPLGGMDTGYKGLGLGLLVELLTSGLAGHGRADRPEKWGASVFLQVINPEAFGGVDAFKKQAQYLNDSFKTSEPMNPQRPVRLPGQQALQRKADDQKSGVPLSDETVSSLKRWADKLQVNKRLLDGEL